MMARTFFLLVYYDLLRAFRSKADWVNAWLFFVLVVSLFPLAVVPDTALLHSIAPGLIWVAALLSMLLSLHYFLRPDYEDGSLAALLLSPYPLPLLMLAKICAQWIVSASPLILITPILGITLQLTNAEMLWLVITLLMGTPILSLVGGVVMALTVGLRHQSVLLSLLVLPLCVPVLIFGSGIVINVGLGLPNTGALALLGALLVLAITLAPFAASGALRSVEM